jgi:hypothetical protein
VCPIEEDDFDPVWASIVLSLAQANHDAKSNAKKKVVRTSMTNNSIIVTGTQREMNMHMETKQASASNSHRADNENNQYD